MSALLRKRKTKTPKKGPQAPEALVSGACGVSFVKEMNNGNIEETLLRHRRLWSRGVCAVSVLLQEKKRTIVCANDTG